MLFPDGEHDQSEDGSLERSASCCRFLGADADVIKLHGGQAEKEGPIRVLKSAPRDLICQLPRTQTNFFGWQHAPTRPGRWCGVIGRPALPVRLRLKVLLAGRAGFGKTMDPPGPFGIPVSFLRVITNTGHL